MKALLLTPVYARALEGLPLLGTPAELAGRYLVGPGSIEERAEAMASTYTLLCASTGFVCGLGGFLTLPVTLPVNLAGVALLQLHLCAATAFMGGHDPRAEAVRERALACLTGTWEAGAERDVAEELIDRSAVKVAERGVRFLLEGALSLASQAGRWGLERAGRWGATRFVTRTLPRRSLPLVGGLLGGASDAYATGKVAEAARFVFLARPTAPRLLAELSAAGNGSTARDS